MKTVTIYTRPFCPYCLGAKNLLTELNIPFTEIDVGRDPAKRQEATTKYNWPTLPIIVVDENCIGGFDDLTALHARGDFLPMLKV